MTLDIWQLEGECNRGKVQENRKVIKFSLNDQSLSTYNDTASRYPIEMKSSTQKANFQANELKQLMKTQSASDRASKMSKTLASVFVICTTNSKSKRAVTRFRLDT